MGLRNGRKLFSETILKLAATKPEISIVNDQRGSLTAYTIDLARAILDLCTKNASGIVHVTNSGDCSWYDFARGNRGCRRTSRPNPSGLELRIPRPAKRPAYSVLSARKS